MYRPWYLVYLFNLQTSAFSGVEGNGRADRLAIKATAASGSCLGRLQSVEELETPPARTEPRTSHHRSPGGERRGMKKRCIDDLPWKDGKGLSSQSDERRNCFQGNVGKTSERCGGAVNCMGFLWCTDAILNRTELIKSFCLFINCICFTGQNAPANIEFLSQFTSYDRHYH